MDTSTIVYTSARYGNFCRPYQVTRVGKNFADAIELPAYPDETVERPETIRFSLNHRKIYGSRSGYVSVAGESSYGHKSLEEIQQTNLAEREKKQTQKNEAEERQAARIALAQKNNPEPLMPSFLGMGVYNITITGNESGTMIVVYTIEKGTRLDWENHSPVSKDTIRMRCTYYIRGHRGEIEEHHTSVEADTLRDCLLELAAGN